MSAEDMGSIIAWRPAATWEGDYWIGVLEGSGCKPWLLPNSRFPSHEAALAYAAACLETAQARAMFVVEAWTKRGEEEPSS